MTQTTKHQRAFERWQELAYRNCETDFRVNDLLEQIAGDKYNDYDELDNPIVEIINRLDEDELDSFLCGCYVIDRDDKESGES